ncbi:MAG TPA: hypothetical protein VFQ65_14710 [Kofleriaceae bacterium]|nr:hypothetical protein [Kofleriaceae bacterium]
MSVRLRLLGFAICFVVGALLSFVAIAVHAVLVLPLDMADSGEDARHILIGGAVFALACDVVRSYVARSPRIPRAHTTR